MHVLYSRDKCHQPHKYSQYVMTALDITLEAISNDYKIEKILRDHHMHRPNYQFNLHLYIL
jgi:ribosomal protein L15E